MSTFKKSQFKTAQETGHTLSEKDSPTCFTHKQGGNGKTLLQKAIFLTVLMTSMLFGEYALAQSDFINGLTAIDNYPINVKQVKRIDISGNEGYFISGFLETDDHNAFVARVDEYGNPIWMKKLEASSDRIVMLEDNGSVIAAYHYLDNIRVNSYDINGVGLFMIELADVEAEPDALKFVDSDYGLLCSDRFSETVYFMKFQSNGNIIFSERYRAFSHSKIANTASFIEKPTGEIFIIYGAENSAVVSFEIDPSNGAMIPSPQLLFEYVVDPWKNSAPVDIHDIRIGSSGDYFVVGALNEQPIILVIDPSTNLIIDSFQSHITPDDLGEFVHFIHLQETAVNDFTAMGIGFNSTPHQFGSDPGKVFLFGLDYGTNGFTNYHFTVLNNTSTPFEALNKFPASFDIHDALPNGFPVVPSHHLNVSVGSPLTFFSGANLTGGCQLMDMGVDGYKISTVGVEYYNTSHSSQPNNNLAPQQQPLAFSGDMRWSNCIGQLFLQT